MAQHNIPYTIKGYVTHTWILTLVCFPMMNCSNIFLHDYILGINVSFCFICAIKARKISHNFQHFYPFWKHFSVKCLKNHWAFSFSGQCWSLGNFWTRFWSYSWTFLLFLWTKKQKSCCWTIFHSLQNILVIYGMSKSCLKWNKIVMLWLSVTEERSMTKAKTRWHINVLERHKQKFFMKKNCLEICRNFNVF